LPIYGTGANIRDWLHVEDHATALWQVATRGATGKSYNVGGNAERTNLQVAHAVCAALDRLRPANAPHESLITFVADRPGHDARYAIDPTRINQELAWEPKHRFETAIADTVEWYFNHEPWWREIIANGTAGGRLGLAASTVNKR